jgi:hypothetical protein
MLWYKSWLETRWRFLTGAALLMSSACGTVLFYPEVTRLLPLAAKVDLGGEIGRQVAQATELARDYRGYVWSQWFGKNMPQLWTLFAVILGTGGLLSQASGGGALFTLSLPASRAALVGVRAAMGLMQLLVLAIVPSLLFPLLSPAIGQTYGLADAVVHGACLFLAGATFFSLAVLLSTVFSDVWRPALIALCAAVAVGLFEQLFRSWLPSSLFHVMSAETYFRDGTVLWTGLLVSVAASGVFLYGATRNIARQDF